MIRNFSPFHEEYRIDELDGMDSTSLDRFNYPALVMIVGLILVLFVW